MPVNKVITFIRGGIGNQMFIYAASRSLAIKNQAELVLITDLFENESHDREFLLANFAIQARAASIRDSDIPYNESHHRVAAKLNRYFQLFSAYPGKYAIERNKGITGKRQPIDKRILKLSFEGIEFVDGFFQNEDYFTENADIIRPEFALASSPSPMTQALAKEILAHQSVCIHIRRTEIEKIAMQEKHGEVKWLDGYREGLDINYYKKAIDIIEKHVTSPRYFCFSDYPEWVKNNFDFPVDITYVEHNNTPSQCHEDIHLMSQCRHHIISHSTFGWWGAWLGKHPGQIVIAPRNTLGRPKPPYYPASWINIDVEQRPLATT